MALNQFCKSAIVIIDGREYILERKLADNMWQLVCRNTGEFTKYSFKELQAMYANSQLVFPMDAARLELTKQATKEKLKANRFNISAKETELVKYKLQFVKAIEGLPKTKQYVEQAVRQLWEKLGLKGKPPHWNTVYRWQKQLMMHGKDGRALINQHQKKGNRKSRYPKAVEDIVKEVIESYYLTQERRNKVQTWERAYAKVERANKSLPKSERLMLPSKKLVKRLIDEIPYDVQLIARHGRTVANRILRSKLKHHVTNHALEIVEIDHTQLDVFVIDSDTGMPLGRPWLTICIDIHTRCIVGFYIGFESPSYLTAAKCLKHALTPKTNLKNDIIDIENEWEAHGVMQKLRVDNGMEFHSYSLENLCLALGIDLEYTPRKQPWFKGYVERVNRTINERFCHAIPGKTFSNIIEKEEYDPEKNAVIDLETLRALMNKWIVDEYHQKPHRGLEGQTPASAWKTCVKPEDIELMHNLDEIDVLVGKTIANKHISHKGIELNRLFYNSAELMALRRTKGDTFKMDIRVDESDLGEVFVLLDNGRDFLTVPAIHYDYAKGLSKWMHEKCRKYAKKQYKEKGIKSYIMAKDAIFEEVVKKQSRKKVKGGKLVRAALGRIKDEQPEAVENSLNRAKTILPISDETSVLAAPVTFVEEDSIPSYAPIIQDRSHSVLQTEGEG